MKGELTFIDTAPDGTQRETVLGMVAGFDMPDCLHPHQRELLDRIVALDQDGRGGRDGLGRPVYFVLTDPPPTKSKQEIWDDFRAVLDKAFEQVRNPPADGPWLTFEQLVEQDRLIREQFRTPIARPAVPQWQRQRAGLDKLKRRRW